ncbi:MAG: ATPase [Bacteroidales bacterium]|nr:ATPase [Bacteroidales bacterium]
MYLAQIVMILLPGKPNPGKWNLLTKVGIVVMFSLLLFDLFPVDVQIVRNSGYTLKIIFEFALITLVFIRAWSRMLQGIYSKNIQSEKLFLFSFLFLIIIGTLFLLLPVSTTKPISITDALFTSTSAVCVTGLVTLDTATQFTWFGKMIIMILIQFGGIGIMTFTSFIASVGYSSHSIQERSALGSSVLSNSWRKLFSALYAVIILTFGIELLGAIAIYIQLPVDAFSDNFSRFTFSVFHSVSAFCNAGFSIAPNGMMNEIFVDTYGLHLTIAGLFIIGGLGFFIVANYSERIMLNFRNFIRKYFLKKEKIYFPNLININSRLVLRTTVVLLILGTGLFLILEYNHSLAGLSFGEKLITSFFSASTPRTAGFNTIDYSIVSMPTLMLVMILMWIGASPGSTGGGIKTTSFAVAFLNAFSLGRGKNSISFHNREISMKSIRKAFLIITFSILSIFIGTILLNSFNSEFAFHALLFEAFSAFGTVGLSLNVTPFLSESSKFVIMVLMFLGRIGIITIFVAFVRKTKYLLYSFPEEDVFI